MWKLLRAAALAMGTLLSGCVYVAANMIQEATREADFVPARPPYPGEALVYIYRPYGGALSGRHAYFYVDGEKQVDIGARGYTPLYLSIGEHQLRQSWPIDMGGFKDLNTRLTVEGGSTYYYRFLISGSSTQFTWSLEQVSEDLAMSELPSCRLYKPQ